MNRTLKNGLVQVLEEVKNGKKISYDAYKKAVKSFWTGKKLTFAKIN